MSLRKPHSVEFRKQFCKKHYTEIADSEFCNQVVTENAEMCVFSEEKFSMVVRNDRDRCRTIGGIFLGSIHDTRLTTSTNTFASSLRHKKMADVLCSEIQDPAPTKSGRHSRFTPQQDLQSCVRSLRYELIWESIAKRRNDLQLLRKE